MTTPPPLPEPPPLDFGRAEFTESPHETTCTRCRRAIHDQYFEANGTVVCDVCRVELSRLGSQGTPVSRFLRAMLAGSAAGVVGSLIYFAIVKLTGYEFGLIAVLVGFAVGGGVKWGCHGRGGRLYQAIAVALTYLAIVSTYVPLLFAEITKNQTAQQSAPATAGGAAAATAATTGSPDDQQPTFGGFLLAIVALLVFAAVAPFLAGFQNIIGLVIIGFALWEAWKITRRAEVIISGPHALAAPSQAATVS